MGETEQRVARPDFLGCNWAASANALIEVGGFGESRGPGSKTVTMGQEASAQHRLLDAGYVGLFLPGEPVLHYVPKERCSPEWALERAERNGRGFGVRYASKYGRWLRPLALLLLTWAKWRCPNVLHLQHRSDFLRMYEVCRWRGFVDGVTKMI
ncbi:MAG: hypothetical protein GY904_15710 [Planctomycetaceae bacterium]|nr:hypothetical protein [Planctomycetaceae bacterium]